jgi:tetraacyldisaccharide 4'-kinase
MLASLYGGLLEWRARLYASGRFASESLPAPVISIGNLTFGGTGKTPFTEHLARRYRFEGRRPAILSRGYGRRSRGVVVVSTGEGPLVGPDRGGDEPVALARRLPGVLVVVGERRVEAAREAARLGADLFLLDDGFQHLAVRRDANILLLDARDPFGGGRLPPRGRLREPLTAIERADVVVFTRAGRNAPLPAARKTVALLAPETPVFSARIRASGVWDESGSAVDASALTGRRLLGVCGVANPDSFEASLREADLAVEDVLTFPDHRRYRERDLRRIHRAASRTGAAFLVTTEKDAVKLTGAISLPLLILRLSVEILEPGFFALLASRLEASAPGQAPRAGA